MIDRCSSLIYIYILYKSALDIIIKYNYTLCMQFEWDENKRKANIRKHSIDFADANDFC
ncbi:hypothetical protein EPICR_370001 [Candidatus Desulfarcum epimagneticum]|uniref:Uncharacterized protein n=1 Tax=uncultured Desulfobacteraceae bacterium TaxID=218296 RepID=A0A484HGT3_9BACT|nr:hypothetical protein EPICR_370001 [uncultured Desulfobacteraceae bacterium]